MLWLAGVVLFTVVSVLVTTKSEESDPIIDLLRRMQREGQVIRTVVDEHPVAVRIEAVSAVGGKQRELLVVDGVGDHATLVNPVWCTGSAVDFDDPLLRIVLPRSERPADDMAPSYGSS
jgi:hypothetical protein